jgi:predicted MFS family arabinose efflux permease
LVYFMAVRIESDNPGSSSAVMQTGGMLGSAMGPAIVGLTTHLLGLPAAWVVVAVATVLGGVVVARARRFEGDDAARRRTPRCHRLMEET